ncbi:MAG: DHH family phosphoesterase [Bacilli bacterium]|nr:DHH family phosphoesterase [Bacilli bacterium]
MDFRKEILNYYSLSEDDYKELTKPLSDLKLPDFNAPPDMQKIKERIFKAIKSKEKVIIYGDYDCDGICSTAIMAKTFEKLGYKAAYYIPTRYNDGYGLNVNNVIKIKEAGFSLIITVDNGISQHEAIDKANELGMGVIVIDHHETPEEQVHALGIIHPSVSHISEEFGCGAFMSLITSAALLGSYDPYLTTLAGLATISDMMELRNFNRNVVRIALDNLRNNRYPTLMSLIEGDTITEKSFGLEVAPKINAVGRLVDDKNINLLVKFLLSEDENEIFKISSWIKNTNELRKTLTKEAVEDLPKDMFNEEGIVIKLDIKEGLIGLIANKLLNEYNVPVIVFTNDSIDKTFLKGSIRSKEGFNVQKAFESLSKYIVGGGGHAFAGGLTIKEADLEAFTSDFIKLCREYKFTKVEPPSIEIKLQDINFTNYGILREFSPFGIGFPEPTFSLKDLPTKSLQFISFGKHLSTPISINSKILGFNMNESEIKSHSSIDLFGNLLTSTYRGKTTVEFRVSDFITKM